MKKNVTPGKMYQQLFFLVFVSLTLLFNSGCGQSNGTKATSELIEVLLPPIKDKYKEIVAQSTTPQPQLAWLDTVSFPIETMNKAFYRALKLRAVYIDIPLESFNIPDFPANSSKQTEAELHYLLDIQKSRTPEMIEKANEIANVGFNPFSHPRDTNYRSVRKNLFYIGHSMGAWFNQDNLPKTADLIANVWQDQLYYMWSFKLKFNRARPVALDSSIKNLEETPWPAYPSGHATFAYTNAFLLQELFQEHKDLIYEDAYETAFSREILGVHFPSDSESGRSLGRQLIDRMLKSEKFKKDLLAAKEEIEQFKKNNKIIK
jgi:acid phosphatase (class A)